jgi:two-component system, LytTR family, response regulator
MIYKTIIIDDEPPAISLIRGYLKKFPQFEVAGACNNGFEGFKMLEEQQPDLVFLDVQMPKLTGFEMLELIPDPPHVIFTTAYDEYAVRAFEKNALDYLLKPISEERFAAAIQKFLDVADENKSGNKSSVRAPFENPQQQVSHLAVKSGNQIKLIDWSEILFIEAYDDYIKINIRGDCFLKKQTMKRTEHLAASNGFVRVHRSYLINLRHVDRIEHDMKDRYIAILSDGNKVPLSRAGYQNLRESLGI